MRRSGGGVLGAVVLVVILVAVAFVGYRFVTNRNAVSVAIIGDSITDISRAVFDQSLGSDYQLNVDGVGGARIDQMEGEADKVAATAPQQLVINLGTNDVVGKLPPDQSMASYEEMVGKFPGTKCLHLVTLNENIVSFVDPDLKNRTVEFNTKLRAFATKHQARVIEWDRIVREYLAAGEPEGHLSNDTIHPTELGQRKLAQATRASLDACRGSLTG